MSAPQRTNIEQIRAALWRTAAPATLADAEQLAHVIEQLARATDVQALVDRGIDLAHSIAGSAGVHGHAGAAQAATSIEALLRGWPAAGSAADATRLVEALRVRLEAAT